MTEMTGGHLCGALRYAMNGHDNELDIAAAILDDPALVTPDDHI